MAFVAPLSEVKGGVSRLALSGSAVFSAINTDDDPPNVPGESNAAPTTLGLPGLITLALMVAGVMVLGR
jgi:hypothetical protein